MMTAPVMKHKGAQQHRMYRMYRRAEKEERQEKRNTHGTTKLRSVKYCTVKIKEKNVKREMQDGKDK